MANTFSKEERVAFEEVLDGFEDALVMSKLVNKFSTDAQQMERSGDRIWRPVKYISQSITTGAPGTDISSAFVDVGQISVPASIDQNRTVPWTMNAIELRESLRNKQFGEAAAQKLASDINVSVMTALTDQGTLVVTKSTAASAFADVAAIEKVMNEQGIPMRDRYLALSTGDYNGLAGDLAGRGTLNAPKTLTAYEQSRVGLIAGFETFKLDYANALAAEGSTTVSVNGANQRHVPVSQTSNLNIDNRSQTLAITVTSGAIAVGDCFTLAGVYSVHPITKVSTGVLKTFRITSLLASSGASGDMTISPAIISADSTPTDIELQYQNCSTVPADGAVMLPLNSTLAKLNPFWYKDAIELLPGTLEFETNAGVEVISGTTENGIPLYLSKQWDINTNKSKYRMDVRYGTVVNNPEMCGVALFGQT